LQVLGVEFISEEPVDFKRMFSVPGIDGAKDIERYAMFLQQPGRLNRSLPCPLAAFILAVEIVQLKGSLYVRLLLAKTPAGIFKERSKNSSYKIFMLTASGLKQV